MSGDHGDRLLHLMKSTKRIDGNLLAGNGRRRTHGGVRTVSSLKLRQRQRPNLNRQRYSGIEEYMAKKFWSRETMRHDFNLVPSRSEGWT